MTPGEEHKFLEKMAGDWTVATTSYMMGNEEQSKGTASKKMVLGGRYLDETLEASMMGMPFSGRNTFAYDNIKKKYRTFWIDNMGTGFMFGEGTREGNTITIWATYPDVVEPTDHQYKLVYRMVNDKQHEFEMYMVDPQTKEETKQMVTVYTRKK